jgi:hypothetical protein
MKKFALWMVVAMFLFVSTSFICLTSWRLRPMDTNRAIKKNTDMANYIIHGINAYFAYHGVAPDSIDSLRTDGVALRSWIQVTQDIWGRQFEYVTFGPVTNPTVSLISYGADGKQGGYGINADIVNIWLPATNSLIPRNTSK